MTDIDNINHWVNVNIHYRPSYHVYWQKPAETLKLRTGNCADMVILKRDMLIKSGVADTRIFVTQIKYKSGVIAYHMVLMVGDKILDNMYNEVVNKNSEQFKKTHILFKEIDAEELTHYTESPNIK